MAKDGVSVRSIQDEVDGTWPVSHVVVSEFASTCCKKLCGIGYSMIFGAHCVPGAGSIVSLHRKTGGIAAMMGTKIRAFAPLPRNVSLQDLVPKAASTDAWSARSTSSS